MTATATRYDLTSVTNHYQQTLAPLHEQYTNTVNQGGQMRGTVGKLYEDIAQGIVYAVDPTLVVKHNDYIMIESRGGSYHKKVQVDLHVYKEGELLCVIECKTYLDSSMLDRACSEFEKIRRVYPGVPCAVFSGQFDVAEETYGWFQDECAFSTFIVNTTTKRDSTNPIFKSCDPLNQQTMQEFAEWIQLCIDNH
jgi:hypothetical protein